MFYFLIVYLAIMTYLLPKIWRNIQEDKYLDSVVDQKRDWFAGKGEWPEDGEWATKQMRLQMGWWEV